VTIGSQDPMQRLGDEMEGMRRLVGQVVIGQSRRDARLDRLDTDVAELKTDVAELKTQLSATKDQLTRFELATDRRFDRIEAQLERLVGLVQRAETRNG
jgi:septal ring factor EnvC (AmiA/AmiB activator)